MRKTWKDKKRKTYWDKWEKRNDDTNTSNKTNATSNRLILSNNGSKKKTRVWLFATTVTRRAIISRLTLNSKKIDKTSSSFSKLCIYYWDQYRRTYWSKRNITNILYLISNTVLRKKSSKPHQLQYQGQHNVSNSRKKSSVPYPKN